MPVFFFALTIGSVLTDSLYADLGCRLLTVSTYCTLTTLKKRPDATQSTILRYQFEVSLLKYNQGDSIYSN